MSFSNDHCIVSLCNASKSSLSLVLNHFHSLFARDTFSKSYMQEAVVTLFSGLCSILKDKGQDELRWYAAQLGVEVDMGISRSVLFSTIMEMEFSTDIVCLLCVPESNFKDLVCDDIADQHWSEFKVNRRLISWQRMNSFEMSCIHSLHVSRSPLIVESFKDLVDRLFELRIGSRGLVAHATANDPRLRLKGGKGSVES